MIPMKGGSTLLMAALMGELLSAKIGDTAPKRGVYVKAPLTNSQKQKRQKSKVAKKSRKANRK